MGTEQMIQIFSYLLIGIIMIIFILLFVLLINWMKKSKETKEKEETQNIYRTQNTKNTAEKQSVFDFMEFDTIEDNMIIQKNGTRFLMVIECQGVNYDLMSGLEKAGVEEGFVQFLNTLRSSIQIYIQTRSINLDESITTYKERLKKIEDKLTRMNIQYDEMVESGQYTQEQLDKVLFEITKQSNLYEYGHDIINNTERMSLNQNILTKKYYIIVPYYASELGNDNLDKIETRNLVFSEIYTRAQSLIGAISTCGVRGKILRTDELVELLYMAYNRDEAETFSIDKAIRAGYNEINSTAADVLDKKMKELDKYIEEKATEKARSVVNEVMSEKAQKVYKKEEKMQDLIDKMAEAIIKENKKYIGADTVEKSIEKIKKEKKSETKEKKGRK